MLLKNQGPLIDRGNIKEKILLTPSHCLLSLRASRSHIQVGENALLKRDNKNKNRFAAHYHKKRWFFCVYIIISFITRGDWRFFEI